MLYFIMGTCLGSFLPVLAKEWADQNIVWFRRSQCDSCLHPLRPWQLIPLLSQVVYHFKCPDCQYHISIKYFIFELFTGLLTLLWFYLFPNTVLLSLFVLYSLLLMALIDYYRFWVPDLLQVLLLILALIYQPSIAQVLYGCFIFACLSLICFLRPNRIGMADIKLLSILALLLPIEQYPRFLGLAATLGLLMYLCPSLTQSKFKSIPFVPAIFFAYILITAGHNFPSHFPH